jgi:hypothetical protein
MNTTHINLKIMIELLLKDAKIKIADHLKSKYNMDESSIESLYKAAKSSLTDSAKSLVFKGKARDMADLFLGNDTDAGKEAMENIKSNLLSDLSKNSSTQNLNYEAICDDVMQLMLTDIQTYIAANAPTKDLKGILKVLGLEGFAMFIK